MDLPIANRAVVAAPKDYNVPLSQEIIVNAVTATLDGTNATVPFLPALQLISDAGDVMWTAVSAGQTVAAGASADVSWFPGLGGGGISGTPGDMVSTYQGQATASDFSWTGPAGSTVTTTYPNNPNWTKFFDNTAIMIISEADFTPGAAADMLTMGIWIDGNNEINVGSATIAGDSFSSVQIARIISPTSAGTGPIAAGSHTISMRVSSFTGQATTLRCHAATDLTILEYFAPQTQ